MAAAVQLGDESESRFLEHLAAGGQRANFGFGAAQVAVAPASASGGNAWHIRSHYAYVVILASGNFPDFTRKGRHINTSVHGACPLTTEGHVPV